MPTTSTQNMFPGSQTIVYAMKEVIYGCPRKPASGDAMFTISETLQGAEERDPRPDRSGQSDHIETVIGRKSATFDVTKLVVPNGAAGVAPDDSNLWEAGFGHLSVGATAVEYILATLHDTALTIRRGVRSGSGISGAADFQDHVMGAIVNNIQVSWGGQGNNGLAQVVFSGEAAEYGHTGNSSLQAAEASGATGLNVSMAKHFSYGSVIAVDSPTPGTKITQTFGGSGALINTANYTSNNLVLDDSYAGGSGSAEDKVKPYNPTATTAGSPIHGRLGRITLDGGASFDVKHVGGQVTLEQNTTLLNEEVGSDRATQVLRSDRRNVNFTLDFIMKQDETYLLGDVRNNLARSLELTLGAGVGKRLMLKMPNAEWEFTPADIPEQEVARISISGKALANNVNDAIIAKFF